MSEEEFERKGVGKSSASTNPEEQLVDALEGPQPAEPKYETTPSSFSKDPKKGHLNGIGDSMFVVKGVSERRSRLDLKVLLDTGADREYVSRTIASRIGELKEGRPVLVDLPSGGSASSLSLLSDPTAAEMESRRAALPRLSTHRAI